MSKIIGIDLGTSNTIAAWADGTEARALVDAETGSALIPSIVSFPPSETVLVGEPAKQRRLSDPKNTIFGAKRLIGRSWGSAEVEEARRQMPFELRRGKNLGVQILVRDDDPTDPADLPLSVSLGVSDPDWQQPERSRAGSRLHVDVRCLEAFPVLLRVEIEPVRTEPEYRRHTTSPIASAGFEA